MEHDLYISSLKLLPRISYFKWMLETRRPCGNLCHNFHSFIYLWVGKPWWNQKSCVEDDVRWKGEGVKLEDNRRRKRESREEERGERRAYKGGREVGRGIEQCAGRRNHSGVVFVSCQCFIRSFVTDKEFFSHITSSSGNFNWCNYWSMH